MTLALCVTVNWRTGQWVLPGTNWNCDFQWNKHLPRPCDDIPARSRLALWWRFEIPMCLFLTPCLVLSLRCVWVYLIPVCTFAFFWLPGLIFIIKTTTDLEKLLMRLCTIGSLVSWTCYMPFNVRVHAYHPGRLQFQYLTFYLSARNKSIYCITPARMQIYL